MLLSLSSILALQLLIVGLPMVSSNSEEMTDRPSVLTSDTISSPAPSAGGTLNNFNSGYDKGLPQSKRYFRDFSFLATGDIDGDNDPDLAFGGGDYSPGETEGVYVYKGDGKGNWTSASSGLPTYDGWGGLAFGDADGDGKIELYAGDEGWGATAGTIDGIGAWEYSSGSWSTSGISSPVTSGHFNNLVLKNFTKGSGLDMAVAHSNKDTYGIKVYYSNGASPISWTSYSSGLPTSGEYTGLAVEDINNDGLPDIAGVSYGSSGMKIFTQKSDGTGWTDRTSSLPSTATSGSMMGVAMADLDNDGNTDIIYCTKDNGMKILLGNGGGSAGGTSFSWTTPTGGFPSTFGTSGRFSQVQLADIDQDGDLDLLAPKAGSGLYLFLGNGTNKPGKGFGWSQVTNKGLPTNMTIYGSAFFDLDGDKDLDLGAATWGDGVKVYRTNLQLSTVNRPPKPKAGNDQTVKAGSTVTLDGTASTDPEDAPTGDTAGTILTYEWNVTSYPTGSLIRDVSLKTTDKIAKPTFKPDKEGNYLINLAVKDTTGKWSNKSDEDQVRITVTNAPPIPNAGQDIIVYLGKTVRLNGTLSNDTEFAPTGDPKGNLLSYDWNITKYPPGSMVRDLALTPNDKNATPSFVPDKVGKYTFTLAVNDSFKKWSNKAKEDMVIIDVLKPNDPPVADAGVDIFRYNNSLVALDGSKSFDIDGSITGYNWTCTDHQLTLSFLDSPFPSFIPNSTGPYTFSLKVKDDNESWSREPDLVKVTVLEVWENLPPSADAGIDQWVLLGSEVTLNGSKSSDQDGYIVTWEWVCTTEPGLFINNSNSSHPTFLPVEEGTYTFTLRVMDNNLSWSPEDMVSVLVEKPFINLRPVALAGPDDTVLNGSLVILDGSSSYDLDGLVTAYNWTCISRAVVLNETYPAYPTFIPLTSGHYDLTLSVMDDLGLWSLEDRVNITVVDIPEPPPPPPPKNVSVMIGPFNFDNGPHLIGATVTLQPLDAYNSHFGIIPTTTTTDMGYAEFLEGIAPGNYSCFAYLNETVSVGPFGLEVLTNGSIRIWNGSIPLAPSPPIDDPDDDDDDPLPDDDDDDPVPDDDDDDPVPDDDDDDGPPGNETGDGNRTSIFDSPVFYLVIALVVGSVIVIVIFLVVYGKKGPEVAVPSDQGTTEAPKTYDGTAPEE
jgi:hypothetical protein